MKYVESQFSILIHLLCGNDYICEWKLLSLTAPFIILPDFSLQQYFSHLFYFHIQQKRFEHVPQNPEAFKRTANIEANQ